MVNKEKTVIEDPVLKRVTLLLVWSVGTTIALLTGGFGVYLSLNDAISQNRLDIQVERARNDAIQAQLTRIYNLLDD